MSGNVSSITRIGPGPRSRAARRSVAAGTAGGLLLVAACQGGGGAPRTAAAHPLATVTITIGNLTISSGSAAAQGQAHRAGAAVANRPAGSAGRAAGGLGAGGLAVGNRASGTRSGAGALVDDRPDLGVRVVASHGRLSSVTVTSAAGTAVAGSYAGGATSWHSGWALSPGQSYQVAATAVSSRGKRAVAAGTFRTMTPAHTFTASVTSITANGTYGVGMPIMVTFSRAIAYRAAVERSLEIWSSKPVAGAWYWMGSKAVWFRPRGYWPAHTRVRFTAHLAGVLGAPGVYGAADVSRHFRIGNSLIAVASAATHYMKVWWNGKPIGNWPISTGQPGDDTPNGRYLSFAMGNPVDMDSASYGVMPGDPGYYNVMVYDSVQFTYSGDYVHSAPWSVGEQGVVNVSHGCVNVAPGNAAWYYDRSLFGDPITVVGSPLAGTWGDGWTIYFLPWRKLLTGSATGEAVTAGPSGSQFVPAALVSPPSHPQAERVAPS